MKKGWIIWVVLLAIMIAVTYFYTGFKFFPQHTTTISVLTTTASTTTSTTTPTTSTLAPLSSCANFQINATQPFLAIGGSCIWNGGTLGIWVKAGNQGPGILRISNTANVTYLYRQFSYSCMTFYQNVTLPPQTYAISLETGSGGGSCGNTAIVLNLTTTPPQIVYPNIYNPSFDNGQYTGWTITGKGFGPGPLNLTNANSANTLCFLGSPWTNYIGEYFATTFECGLNTSPGNLTSLPFRVDPRTPFLNFRIVSPDDNNIFLEILQKNTTSGALTPKVIGHFNTYNISTQLNASSTFANASIPLTTLVNKVIVIRIVSQTLVQQRYMAVGDFELGGIPHIDHGVAWNVSVIGLGSS